MSPKSYGLIFASHSSTASLSGFSKDKLGMYVGKSVCEKNKSFTCDTSVEAMTHWNSPQLRIWGLVVRVH